MDHDTYLLKKHQKKRGASMARLVEYATLDYGVMSLNPMLGVETTLKKKYIYIKIIKYLIIILIIIIINNN